MKAVVFILLGVIIERALTTQHPETNGTPSLGRGRKHYINVLIQDLNGQVWPKDETRCFQKTLLILNAIKNSTLWATWMWDSIQLPVGILFGSRLQLGNFDECLNAPWKTSHPELRAQYCLADVQLSSSVPQRRSSFDPYGSTIPYIESLTKYDMDFRTIIWGVCVPEVCKPVSISKIVKTLLRNSHLGSMGSGAVIEVDSCQVAGKSCLFTSGFSTFTAFALTLIVTVLISTWYVNGLDQKQRQSTIIENLANSFCLNKNIQDLVKLYKDDIKVLHGIRFLSACAIVMFHHFSDLNSVGSGNAIEVEKFIDSSWGLIFVHANLAVDTFFVLSGLLLAKSYMSQTIDNPVLLLLKRYIRLTGPFAVMVFYMAAVSIHVGSGPLWPSLAGHQQASCQKNWWLSLLMVSNVIETEKKHVELCYPGSWSIQCDYQLAVLGTVLFYLRRKSRHVGVAAFVAVAVMSILIPGLITFWNEYPAVIHFKTRAKTFSLKEIAYLWYIYLATYSRASAYVVGLASGYFIYVYKPAAYRRVMSQTQSLFVFSLGMVLISMIVHLGGENTREFNVLEASVFVALYRITWAVAVVSIVAACEYGTVPIINDFLSWSVFVPLSKLSYGISLIHPAILQRNLFSTRSPLNMDFFTMITDLLGYIVVSCFASLVMWLLIEAPVANLSKLVFDSKCCLRTQQIKDKEK